MKIEIQPASLEDKTILRNLMELYAYDFSEFEQSDVDEHGLFGYERLDHYWTEPGRYPFLVRAHGRLRTGEKPGGVHSRSFDRGVFHS